ncbi:hypothetical protein D3C87_1360520 [compost metagenome]
MGGAGARRRLGAIEGVVHREAHPLDHRFQHRHVDPLAAPGLAALDQRRQDIAVGIHAGGDVRHRGPRLDALFGRASHRDEPRFALHQQVVGFLVPIGAVAAVARDIADDQARIAGRQRLVIQPEPGRRPRGEVLHQHVRARQQPFHHRRGAGRLHVQRQAFLRTVGPDEMRRQAAHARVVGAGEIPRAGPLDLDHARAKVRQLAGAERRGNRLFEGDDGNAG